MQQGADCDHAGRTIYTRRKINGGEQFCIQCTECMAVVKSPAHGHRPYIKLAEVPVGETIYPFIEGRIRGNKQQHTHRTRHNQARSLVRAAIH